MNPLYIQVDSRDNVAIIANPEGLAAGVSFPGGLTLQERIPQSHKVALRGLDQGAPIVRYGQVIGYASRRIEPGAWVREDSLDLPKAPPLDRLSLATEVPAPLPALAGYTFEGFRNADGSVATKHLIGTTTP